MKLIFRLVLLLTLAMAFPDLSAQNYKADRLRKAVKVLGLQIVADSLMPDTFVCEPTR